MHIEFYVSSHPSFPNQRGRHTYTQDVKLSNTTKYSYAILSALCEKLLTFSDNDFEFSIVFA